MRQAWRRPQLQQLLPRAVRGQRRSFFGKPTPQQLRKAEIVPYTREQFFRVVADVSRYSEFLPFCSVSRIERWHSSESFDATLGLGYLGLKEEYTSRVTLVHPHSIVAESKDTHLFSLLKSSWHFRDVGSEVGSEVSGVQGVARGTSGGAPPRATDPRCRLKFSLDVQVQSHVYDGALRKLMETIAERQIDAFKLRCEALYPLGEGSPLGEVSSLSTVDATHAHHAPTDSTAGPRTPTDSTAGPRSAGRVSAVSPQSRRAPSLRWRPQYDPRWRMLVESAFDKYAERGSLSFRAFTHACRALATKLPELGAELAQTALGRAAVASLAPGTPIDSRSLLAGAFFVEFDSDGNGTIERDEFLINLWMMTRGSDEDRMCHAFARLDMNGSGKLERDDLVRSMERQLALARTLTPMLVQQQLHRHAIAADRASVNACAIMAAQESIGHLHSQIDETVDDLFAQLGVAHGGAVSFGQWCAGSAAIASSSVHHADSRLRDSREQQAQDSRNSYG